MSQILPQQRSTHKIRYALAYLIGNQVHMGAALDCAYGVDKADLQKQHMLLKAAFDLSPADDSFRLKQYQQQDTQELACWNWPCSAKLMHTSQRSPSFS